MARQLRVEYEGALYHVTCRMLGDVKSRLFIDTDGDHMPDWWEVKNHLNPEFNDAQLDTDNDGLTNLGEYQAGTDPNNPDMDNDGLLDGIEINMNTDPFNPDTNKPIVVITFPANNYKRIWFP